MFNLGEIVTYVTGDGNNQTGILIFFRQAGGELTAAIINGNMTEWRFEGLSCRRIRPATAEEKHEFYLWQNGNAVSSVQLSPTPVTWYLT